MSVGKKGIHFEGGLSKSPLKVGFSIPGELSDGKLKVSLGFDFTPGKINQFCNWPILKKLKLFSTSFKKVNALKLIVKLMEMIFFQQKAF